MARPPPVQKLAPPAERLRAEIVKAVDSGADLSALTLQLTLGDSSRLRRDASLGPDDISFMGGEMRFLGVRVVEGGTASSTLVIAQT